MSLVVDSSVTLAWAYSDEITDAIRDVFRRISDRVLGSNGTENSLKDSGELLCQGRMGSLAYGAPRIGAVWPVMAAGERLDRPQLNGTEIPVPAPKNSRPKFKPGAENGCILPLATYKYPLPVGVRYGLSAVPVGGRLSSTAAGTVNCPAESGALQLKEM